MCTHKLGGDRFQLGDIVQCAGVFDVYFCSVVRSSLCLLGQHYLVTSLKFMALVLRVHDGSICNSIGEPSAKLHNVYENPKKRKSCSILLLSSLFLPLIHRHIQLQRPLIQSLIQLLKV